MVSIGDNVKIVNTGDAFEGLTGTVEYVDDSNITVFVNFREGKRVRQDFDVNNVVSSNEVSDDLKESKNDMAWKNIFKEQHIDFTQDKNKLSFNKYRDLIKAIQVFADLKLPFKVLGNGEKAIILN